MGEQQDRGAAVGGLGKLDIGSVLGRSFGVIRRNPISLGLVTLIYVAFNALTYYLFLGDMMDSAMSGGGVAVTSNVDFATVAIYWVVAGVFSAFLVALVTYGTVQDLRGRPAGFGDWLRHSVNVVLPMILLAIVWYVIIAVGMILLIVPGIILMLMLWVVFPVMVMERPGVIGSLRRSAFLTKGNRWRLLGLFLLLAVIMGVLMAATLAVPFAQPGSILGGAVSAVLGIFWLVVLAVTYHDLRLAREGVDIGRVTAVFD